jgi:hypothetical protein
MMRSWLASLIGAVALPACSSPAPRADAGPANPSVLWLAPDMMEIHVKLVDAQPPPF